jgi:hypothetical protein
VRRGVLEESTARGLPALVWTPNDEAEISGLMAQRRVTGIITDRPELAAGSARHGAIRRVARAPAGCLTGRWIYRVDSKRCEIP